MDNKTIRKLLKNKNVMSVGMGLKTKDGVSTGESAVVVGVKKKLPVSQLAAKDVIPQSIDGTPSDVIEVGEIKALGNTARVRPCPGGVSCGSWRITAGTLGAWVNQGGRTKLLSNNHVLADVNQGKAGDAILQPGTYDGGQTSVDTIAELETFTPIKFTSSNIWQMILDWLFRRPLPLNTVDCALAAPVEGPAPVIDPSILGIGVPAGIVEPTVGMAVQKNGRTTGLTTGKISQVNVTAKVNMGNGKLAIFTDQIMVSSAGFSAAGDSGSAVLTSTNLVGLLFAGSESPPVTLCNRFSNVKAALNLT